MVAGGGAQDSRALGLFSQPRCVFVVWRPCVRPVMGTGNTTVFQVVTSCMYATLPCTQVLDRLCSCSQLLLNGRNRVVLARRINCAMSPFPTTQIAARQAQREQYEAMMLRGAAAYQVAAGNGRRVRLQAALAGGGSSGGTTPSDSPRAAAAAATTANNPANASIGAGTGTVGTTPAPAVANAV
jgi:hypothetical protein